MPGWQTFGAATVLPGIPVGVVPFRIGLPALSVIWPGTIAAATGVAVVVVMAAIIGAAAMAIGLAITPPEVVFEVEAVGAAVVVFAITAALGDADNAALAAAVTVVEFAGCERRVLAAALVAALNADRCALACAAAALRCELVTVFIRLAWAWAAVTKPVDDVAG